PVAAQLLVAAQAQVVAAAFEQCSRERRLFGRWTMDDGRWIGVALSRQSSIVYRHNALQRRDILEEQLVLEVDRVGGDDHSLATLGCEDGRRDEVAEAFAGAGAGLDHDGVTVVEGVRDGLGHGDLWLALLIALEGAAHGPLGREEAPDRLNVER